MSLDEFGRDPLTTALAFLGVVTGVWGLHLNRKAQATKVRVTPETDSFFTDSEGNQFLEAITLAADVVNDSHFPITVVEVGAVMRGMFPPRRYMPIYFDLEEGVRIEPRNRVVLRTDYRTRIPNERFWVDTDVPTFPLVEGIKALYVQLATGERFQGNSKALAKFVSTLVNFNEERMAQLRHPLDKSE